MGFYFREKALVSEILKIFKWKILKKKEKIQHVKKIMINRLIKRNKMRNLY